MADTATEPGLLLTCVQDLHAGCDAFKQRWAATASHARDSELRRELDLLIDCAAQRAERLEVMDAAAEGPANLWMAGVLDDAERDTQTIAPGELLDIALIGAVRKAIVAELVSHETAITLACKLDADPVLRALQDNRTQLGQIDDALAQLLATITKAGPTS